MKETEGRITRISKSSRYLQVPTVQQTRLSTRFVFKLQERPQNGASSTADHRRRSSSAHKNAQLPTVRVQPSQGFLLQVQHLNQQQNITHASRVKYKNMLLELLIKFRDALRLCELKSQFARFANR